MTGWRRAAQWVLCTAALVTALGAAPVPAHGQYSLVLSGGGARGLAHAGAIAALEEKGYGTSLVVGTSMGSIVGALYAAGYSAAEIRELIAGENWLVLFAAEPIVAGRERVARRPVVNVGISRGRFYEGLLPATGVNRHLVELLFDAGVRAHNDFDRLPRRYRAVAADLGTGRQVVLGAGNLPRAVRASMAVPSAFAPVWIDGRVLVDGGIANNLPVSVADSLAGLPVVAVDVLALDTVVVERSALNLGVRAIRLLIQNARPTADPELLITPDIPVGFSEARFPADAMPLVMAGAAAVRTEAPPAELPALPARAPDAAPERLDTVIVQHADAAVALLLRRMLEPALGAYDPAAILARVDALYGTSLFQAVWPHVERLAEGRYALVVDVTPFAATGVAAAAGWDSDVGGAVWAVLRQRLSIRTPWELRVQVELGELGRQAAADVSAFSSLLPGLTWNGGVFAGRERTRLFTSDSIRGHRNYERMGGWLGAEVPALRRGVFASLRWAAETLDAADIGESRIHGPSLRVAPDPMPDRVVGVDAALEVDVRLGDVAYSVMHVAGERRVRIHHLRLAVVGDVAHTTGFAPLDVRPAATMTLAPWLDAGALRSRSRAVLGLDLAWPAPLDGYLRLRGRAFATAADPASVMWRDVQAGGELGGVWPTVVGPLSAGVAWGSGGRARVNVAVGLSPGS